MRAEAKANLVFALAGVAVGLLALFLKVQARYLGLIGLAILALMLKPSQKMFILDVQKSQKIEEKNKTKRAGQQTKIDKKWLLSNCVWPYLTTWFAVWVVALNV